MKREGWTLAEIRSMVEAGMLTWDDVPWTTFQPCEIPTDDMNALDPPTAVMVNSRYQVSVYARGGAEAQWGAMVHLSIKTHDRSARHDWRDLQRIKNELCGPECEAVELFPAESRLVDGANQYHLFVFRDFRFPFGFNERLVADGDWRQSKQRPWRPEDRPADCMDTKQFDAYVRKATGK